MVQGAGRPGQPTAGQRSIFGNGPGFTQMPNYTPVTREQAGQGAHPTGSQSVPPAPHAPQPAPNAGYTDPAFQTAQPQTAQPQGYAGHQPAPVQPQVPPPAQPQGVSPASPSFGDLPDLSNADPAFPESIFGDFQSDATLASEHPGQTPGMVDYSFPDQPLSDQTPADEAYYPAPQHDAAFDPSQQAYHPQSYPAQQPQGQTPHAQVPHAQVPHAQVPHAQAPQAQEAAYGQVPPADPNRQLQAFDVGFDQPPQIPLGDPQSAAQPSPHALFEADRGDADFMDESQALAASGAKSKWSRVLKGRSAVMVGSSLLGALALGGALAAALQYWPGGGSSGDAPVITADATPVKEVPDQPGGKEFPHKNKLIYDRLTNGDTPQSERLVPRQENVAVPALPQAGATAGLPAPVATTDLTNPATTQSLPGAEGEEGGPRKVKTLVVRPDGSVEAPAAAGAVDQAAGGAVAAANQAVGAAAAQANNAVGQAANAMPVPPLQAAPQQVAAADPAAAAPAAAATDAKYVVQLGSNKSQTEALASFADAQQKHPSLLGNYQPIVRKTDLGDKGIWYRLQVGPMADKSAAYKLCGDLKSQGHGDCLVMAQ